MLICCLMIRVNISLVPVMYVALENSENVFGFISTFLSKIKIMPCHSTSSKMFGAGPNILCRTKN